MILHYSNTTKRRLLWINLTVIIFTVHTKEVVDSQVDPKSMHDKF